MTAPPLLRATSLSRIYTTAGARSSILSGLNVELRGGEIVAVVGRSGSGKTTLLNLIGAMDRPDSGRLEFEGEDMSAWDDRARTAFRRARLGFVFQAFNLLPTLTVRENIALPLELNGLPEAARVAELLDELSIAALADRFPDQISGGEQQRTAIARAIAHRPRLIIADEPTGNLDRDTGREVIALFERCVRAAGATLLMATHSDEMLGHADRVLELRDGALSARP
ncbi:MAG: ABC transporter ATP-binding protein [Proteobacteria bacterium]|jgi:putative ABC transport system ATP-binding protein|nr:ABC transporter ATP-binding protein [Pseudomonadota bacterium]MBK8961206.1 ABC transporter ATP-binding protein [Pseudomonadota bacterium]